MKVIPMPKSSSNYSQSLDHGKHKKNLQILKIKNYLQLKKAKAAYFI